MNKFEELIQEASNNNVNSIDYQFTSKNIKGLYCDGTIAIKKDLTSTEKNCVLAEELGHHFTSSGNILDMSVTENRKQERHARLWAYNKLIGLNGIINAYKAKCKNMHDMADYLDVTEEFLTEALECYKSKYGEFVVFDNYVIYFEPNLGIFELM